MKRCASKDAGLQPSPSSLFPEGGVDTRRCARKDAGPRRGENLPLADAF